ncbi:hypothetical protein Tco_0386010 [Tanacetum coccineum]
MPKYTIKSTDKAALKEYDPKSMYENKSFNRNLANHALYHSLMESLIEDENAMDKGVADTVKNHKRQHDDDEDPSVGPNQGKKEKRRRTKELESSKKPSTTKETSKDDAVNTASENVVRDDDQPQDTSEPKTNKTLNEDWFKQPPRPPTPDPKWNKRQVVLDQPEQPWFNQMNSATKDPLTFNDLMAALIDFFKYVLNRLKIDNLTQDLLLGPAYNLLKGTCTSIIELKYNFQECFNALRDKFDWNNPEGDQYLKTSDPETTYTTSITKTKSARYEIVGIEDITLTLWKGNFVDLYLNDIKDMLLLAVQHKLFHLNESDIVEFIVALSMFKRSVIIKRQVEDLQLGVESYQKKLNITAPQKTFLEIKLKELYTPSYKPPGVIYEELYKQKRVMRADELYKFSDGTLKNVHDKLHHRILNFHLGYNDKMSRRKWTAIDKKRSELMVELIDKQI